MGQESNPGRVSIIQPSIFRPDLTMIWLSAISCDYLRVVCMQILNFDLVLFHTQTNFSIWYTNLILILKMNHFWEYVNIIHLMFIIHSLVLKWIDLGTRLKHLISISKCLQASLDSVSLSCSEWKLAQLAQKKVVRHTTGVDGLTKQAFITSQ